MFDIFRKQHKFQVESASDLQTKHVKQPPPTVNTISVYRVMVLFSDDSSNDLLHGLPWVLKGKIIIAP
jgi:hypothetical protein